jgi:arylsulfatase A-like enzyme
VHAPNFKRLAEHSVTFDNAYAGSLPCMPARRELHTGRYNFLHRSWGPLEPFDNSMPEILKNNGIYTHLISDHYHYWEEGGANYHTKFNTWEISRGQEGDPWVPTLGKPESEFPNPGMEKDLLPNRDWYNREQMKTEDKQPMPKTYKMGTDFIDKFHKEDNWFLQLETFDPHEPYFMPEKYEKFYNFDFSKVKGDWIPSVREGDCGDDVRAHYRHKMAALTSMCDHYLGTVLDKMDKYNLWEDTMLIVNTDHGFLLGEHDFWGKCNYPFYNEVVNTPLFIWDPRSGVANQHRKALVQTIDLPATILEYFGVEIPEHMEGKSLKESITDDKEVRESALFGIFGGHVNVTDGRYVYMRAPVNDNHGPLYQYTLMPAHMRDPFGIKEFKDMELQSPFKFTKNCSTMKINAAVDGCYSGMRAKKFGNLLYDLEDDPEQKNPINDKEIENRMTDLLIRAIYKNDAPVEQYVRLGLQQNS